MSTPPAAPGPPPFLAPPDHPAEVWEHSLAELEGRTVEKGAYGMGSTAWLARALVSPLRQLGAPELRLLLSQGRGLPWTVPLALERLQREPLAAADYGPGDLLTALLAALADVDPAGWGAGWRERLARVAEGARAALPLLPDARARARRAGTWTRRATNSGCEGRWEPRRARPAAGDRGGGRDRTRARATSRGWPSTPS
jgi:hypothetical protein